MTLTVLFPVLNEHLRLERGIDRCVSYVRDNISIPVKMVIVDNGSDDDTPDIARRLEEKYSEVSYRRIEERGVGIAFKTGVLEADSDIVGYMDIDLSTDLKYLKETIRLFEEDPELMYVNGSRFSKQSNTTGRKWYRKITSKVLVFMLKSYLGMKASDALCGFTFIRTCEAKKLVEKCTNDKGWFYTVEFLLRAERAGMKILDMPVEWAEDYDTTVRIFKTVKNYIVRMVKIKKTFRMEERSR